MNSTSTLLMLLACCCPTAVTGFLFPLRAGAQCRDNADCASPSFPRGCCLMTGRRHGRPLGRCQPIARLGDYCAPGERLRQMSGYSVYTFSCPCDISLTCRPADYTDLHQMTVYRDPQCVPVGHPQSVYVVNQPSQLELGVKFT